jgi:hypothetical protein
MTRYREFITGILTVISPLFDCDHAAAHLRRLPEHSRLWQRSGARLMKVTEEIEAMEIPF